MDNSTLELSTDVGMVGVGVVEQGRADDEGELKDEGAVVNPAVKMKGGTRVGWMDEDFYFPWAKRISK